MLMTETEMIKKIIKYTTDEDLIKELSRILCLIYEKNV